MDTSAETSTAPDDARPSAPIKGLRPDELDLYRQIPSEIRYVDHESFSLPSAEGLYGPADGEQFRVPAWEYSADLAEDVDTLWAKALRLSRDDERMLFLKYNYARHRLALLLGRARRPSAVTAREVIYWQKRATALRAVLVRANMALVVAMANRC